VTGVSHRGQALFPPQNRRMGLVEHPSRRPRAHPFGTVLQCKLHPIRRGSQPSHGCARAFVKVPMTVSTAIGLHDRLVLETASAIFDDGFAVAMGTLQGHSGGDISILAIPLEWVSVGYCVGEASPKG